MRVSPTVHMLNWNPWLASLLTTIIFLAVFVIGSVLLIRKKTILNTTIGKFWGRINTRPKRIVTYVIVGVLALMLLVPIYRGATYMLNYRYISDGYAEWRHSGNQQYLYVEAQTPYDLGYLQGQYLYAQIFNFRLILLGQYIGDYESMKLLAEEYAPYVPEDYEQEMRGMAVGASRASGWPITYLDILLQNTYLDIYFGQEVPQSPVSEPMGCTAFGVKNDDGSIILGQNFDFPKIMGEDDLRSLAYVHTNLTGRAEIFGLRVGAMLSIPSAKNSHGVYTLVNIIESNIVGDFMMPSTLRTRYALERATTAAELFEMSFNGRNQSHAANLMIGDADSIIGVQILPDRYRTQNNTLIVHSNRFIYEDWNEDFFTQGDYSLPRQNHAEFLWNEAYAAQTPNHVNHDQLLEILGNCTAGFGEGSEICRTTTNPRTSMTLAFFTSEYFGLGNVNDGLGQNPL